MRKLIVAAVAVLSALNAYAQTEIVFDDYHVGVLACPVSLYADQAPKCKFNRKTDFISLFDMSTEVTLKTPKKTFTLEEAEVAARKEFDRMATEFYTTPEQAALLKYSESFITDVQRIRSGVYKFTGQRRIMGIIPVDVLMDGMGRRIETLKVVPLEGYMYVTHRSK